MAVTDLLQTCAEIGIGLAGFTGIVAALQSRGGAAHGPLVYLLGYSIGSVMYSLLPLVLMLALPAEASWRISAALLLVGGLAAAIPYWLPGSRLRPESVPLWEFGFAVWMVVLFLGLGGVSLGLLEERAAWVYACGIFYTLAMSFAAFIRLLTGGITDA